MSNFISEDDIEQAILKKLNQQCGYELLNCYTVDATDLNDGSNRLDKCDVIFEDRLRQAALRLNPTIPKSAFDDALERLMDKRRAMSPVAANCEIDDLIRDGIPVVFDDPRGRTRHERVRVIDFNDAGQIAFASIIGRTSPCIGSGLV